MTEPTKCRYMRKYAVSVLIGNPPHPYSTNARLEVIAATTDEVYDLVARRYPSGVVMGLWDRGPVAARPAAAPEENER